MRIFRNQEQWQALILRRNKNLYTVQQTAPHVFRINNTFYTPTQLITYYQLALFRQVIINFPSQMKLQKFWLYLRLLKILER
jgi:hypothetical protein